MNQDTRDQITWFLGTAVSLAVIVGMATRFILFPWLRDHLATPLRQVEKQVSENSHKNQEPTVLDRIDDVGRDVKALAHVFDEHLSFSDRWIHLIERELEVIQAQIHRHHPSHRDPNGPEEGPREQ